MPQDTTAAQLARGHPRSPRRWLGPGQRAALSGSAHLAHAGYPRGFFEDKGDHCRPLFSWIFIPGVRGDGKRGVTGAVGWQRFPRRAGRPGIAYRAALSQGEAKVVSVSGGPWEEWPSGPRRAGFAQKDERNGKL